MIFLYPVECKTSLIVSDVHLRLLVEQLERVDASALESSAKLAFWINVYNSLVMHVNLDCY